MEDLILPILKEEPPPPKRLTMTQYVKFVEFAWKVTPNKEQLRKQRDKDVPTVMFVLK